MIRQTLHKERRKDRRFSPRTGAFIVLRPDYTKLGQIIDVSAGGLAFRYMAGERLTIRSAEMDIFIGNNGFHLARIPFETVSDFETGHDIPFSSITMRRSSVKFGKLTDSQLAELKHFIQNYTTEEAKTVPPW